MFITIYTILVSILALIFLFYGIYVLNSKKATSFMFNKIPENIDEKYLKQYNRGISILYILISLFLFILSYLGKYFNFRLLTLLLLILLVAIIPSFSTIQIFLSNKYSIHRNVENNVDKKWIVYL